MIEADYACQRGLHVVLILEFAGNTAVLNVLNVLQPGTAGIHGRLLLQLVPDRNSCYDSPVWQADQTFPDSPQMKRFTYHISATAT